LSAEKRPHLLLDTLRFLPDEAQLGIVGEGPMHRKMIHDGMDLMYQGRVHFLGKHPSGTSLYTLWQMTLLTSRYEGCPMTALESLACGVPCVSLPIPAMRELYDLDAAYLLARGDAPVALAEAVMTVLSLPEQQVRDDMARIVARPSHVWFFWSLARGAACYVNCRSPLDIPFIGCTLIAMLIEFDSAKRYKTLAERDLDFARAAEVFEGIHLTAPDSRQDYTEDRLVVLVWTPRDEVRRIISMRKANDREKAFYARYVD